jgi:hypothetical protein
MTADSCLAADERKFNKSVDPFHALNVSPEFGAEPAE